MPNDHPKPYSKPELVKRATLSEVAEGEPPLILLSGVPAVG